MLGPFYAFFSDGTEHLYPFVNGAIAAFLLALSVLVLELGVFKSVLFRRVRFIYLVIIRFFIYLIVIVFITYNVFLISRMVRFDRTYREISESAEFYNYIFHQDYFLDVLYALIIILAINFIWQMNRNLGQGVLLAYLTGKYSKARQEERVFLFITLDSAKEIEDALGPFRFHRFLNDMIYDLTDPIVAYRGVIYEYVQEQLVVSWPIKTAIDNANCIRVLFDIRNELEMRKGRYFETYGFVPGLRAAGHCGAVVRAEIGEVRSELAYFGDTLSITSRILDTCRDLGLDLLLSKDLLNIIELPAIYVAHKVGKFKLKGRTDKTPLYTVKEIFDAEVQL